MFRGFVILSCVAVILGLTIVVKEIMIEDRKQPVFFGMRLGREYKSNEYKYFDFADDKELMSNFSHWLEAKFKAHDRPYYFGHIKMAEYVKPEICRIKTFYGQDMAMMLLTKTQNRLIGVVVAVKCEKAAINAKIGEMHKILVSKHEHLAKVEAPDWLQTSTLLMARSPDLWTRNNIAQFIQLVDKTENFEVSIMGVSRDRGIPMMSTENADMRFNITRMADRAITYRPSGESYETHSSSVISKVKEWQVHPTTLAEVEQDMQVLNIKEPADVDVGYVYLVLMLHDQERYIDDEIKSQKRAAEARKSQEEYYRKEVQRQNESAL